MGLALASGLVITHSLVPPPGPVGVAGIFGVSVSSIILYGIIISIPMVLACLVFAKYAGNKIWQIPTSNGKWTRDKNYVDDLKTSSVYDESNLPSAFYLFLQS